MKIHYTTLWNQVEGIKTIEELATWGDISFLDAGFASLTDHRSVGGNFLIPRRVNSQDGAARCHGGIIDRRCAKIHRPRRSSLAAETNAAIAAADWALWFQVFLIQIHTRKFCIRQVSHPTSSRIRNPPGSSPPAQQLKTEIMLAAAPYCARKNNSEDHIPANRSTVKFAHVAGGGVIWRLKTSIEHQSRITFPEKQSSCLNHSPDRGF